MYTQFYGVSSDKNNKTLLDRLLLLSFYQTIEYINKYVLSIKTTFQHKLFSIFICRVVNIIIRATLLTFCTRIIMELCQSKLIDVLSKLRLTQLGKSILLFLKALEMFSSRISAVPDNEQHMSSRWSISQPKSLSNNLTNNGFTLTIPSSLLLSAASKHRPFLICSTSLLLLMESNAVNLSTHIPLWFYFYC